MQTIISYLYQDDCYKYLDPPKIGIGKQCTASAILKDHFNFAGRFADFPLHEGNPVSPSADAPRLEQNLDIENGN